MIRDKAKYIIFVSDDDESRKLVQKVREKGLEDLVYFCDVEGEDGYLYDVVRRVNMRHFDTLPLMLSVRNLRVVAGVEDQLREIENLV